MEASHFSSITWNDFFLCAPVEATCKHWMLTFYDILKEIGIPIAHEKTIGPSSRLTYLGIEINTLDQSISLPEDKLSSLLTSLNQWKNKRKCTKRELLSLIGSLSFAAKVVKSGRTFLRRLIALSTSVTRLHHHISLNKEARADITWWVEFLPTWNGVAFFQENPVLASDL